VQQSRIYRLFGFSAEGGIMDATINRSVAIADIPESGGDQLFRIAVLFSFILFGAAGYYLKTHNPPPAVMEERVARTHQVAFIIEEKPATPAQVEAPKPDAPAPVKKEIKPEPIDFTRKIRTGTSEEAVKEASAAPTSNPVRKVYGLRKVYSTGIGAGGTAADAVIGKLGNTIEKSFDTLVATEKEIKGEIVSVASVTTAPSFRKKAMPTYTKDMLENRVEGVVRVKALVDIDGRVKKATPLNDIGFEAAHQAMVATLAMEFNPAMRDSEPVAVWIIIPIRFVMIG
jgi:hypothetical protein